MLTNQVVPRLLLPVLLLQLLLSLTSEAFIVSISHLEQQKGLIDTRQKCIRATSTSVRNNASCQEEFDGIACWPETAAGEIAFIPCPNYMNYFDTSARAERHCMPDGQWRFSFIRNSTRGKYSACYSENSKAFQLSEIAVASHLPYVHMVYMVGYSISICALLAAIITLIWLRRLLKCPRNIFHMNLFVSFILRGCLTLLHIFLLPSSLQPSTDPADLDIDGAMAGWQCKLLTSVWEYAKLSNCMWILMEALYLHLLLFVLTFSNKSGTKKIILAGWGVPLLFVLPWVAVKASVDDVGCWILTRKSEYKWIKEAPAILIVVLNFGFFANFVRLLSTKLKASESNTFRFRISRRLAKSTVVLIPLFGVHYMVFLFTEFISPETMDPTLLIVRSYFDTICTSLQGLAVAILFCFCNEEISSEIKKRWMRYKLSKGWNVMTVNIGSKPNSTQRASLSSDGGGYQMSSRRQSSIGPTSLCNKLRDVPAIREEKPFLEAREDDSEEKLVPASGEEKSDENQNLVVSPGTLA